MSDIYLTNLPQFLPNVSNSSSAAASISHGGAAAKKSTATEEAMLGILARIHEPSGGGSGATTKSQSVAKAHGAQHTRGAEGTRLGGQSFVATMPPPAAPKVVFNKAVQQNYQTFAQESRAALGNVGDWASHQPALQATVNPIAQGATQQEAAAAAADWHANTSVGGPTFVNGSLLAFMKLRIENSDNSINSMQELASSACDLQGDMAQEQVAAAKAAEAEAQAANSASQKANKKQGIMGIFNKVFAVVLAVVCVVAAFLTCDPAIAAIGIALAVSAFVIAGAVKGQGKGGFDFWGGLDMFNNVIGVVDGAMLLKAVAKTAVEQAVKAGVKTALKAGLKAAEKVGSSVIGETAMDAVKQSTREVARETAKHVGKMMEKIETSLAKVNNKLALPTLGQNGTKVAKNLGTGLNLTAGAVTVAQGADEMLLAGYEYDAAMHQANADAHLADVELLKAMVKMLDTTYKSANELVQTLVKSHGNAVDQTQAMLKSNSDVSNLIATNMAQI